MYCFLASLSLGCTWPGTRPTTCLACCCMPSGKKLPWKKETSPRRQSAASSSRILSAICCPPFKFYDDAPAKAKDSLGLFADYMRVSIDAFNYNGLVFSRGVSPRAQLRRAGATALWQQAASYDIEPRDFLLPALTLQPLVETQSPTALATSGRRHCDHCTREEPDNWLITVQDDGCGTDTIAADGLPPQQGGRGSSAWQTRQRVESIARDGCILAALKIRAPR